jgi:tetratricopeptide (TPR) repeat protein
LGQACASYQGHRPDEASLIAKIDPTTPAYRATSLRFTEEGKRFLESGKYAKALARFEKTVAIDASNPYAYYYLAKTHHQMGHYQDSLNFLDVAEPLLFREPYWLAEVHALRGENLYALGFFKRAGSSYSEALRWNRGNRMAAEGLDRIQGRMPFSPR